MTIVVMDYSASEVIIHQNVDCTLIEEKYDNNVERYLVEEHGYRSDEIYYMYGDITMRFEN